MAIYACPQCRSTAKPVSESVDPPSTTIVCPVVHNDDAFTAKALEIFDRWVAVGIIRPGTLLAGAGTVETPAEQR